MSIIGVVKAVKKKMREIPTGRLSGGNMTKIDLITGFLGAGKTTFLLKYARYLMKQGLNIGILEYDYGAVNVDMMLLGELQGDQCELEMVSAACDADCLRRRFRTKLISMGMCGYDRVLVEPSGVFDMDEFFDILREAPLDRWYQPGSVIAVVNAGLEDRLGEEADFLLASQCADAGCILLSRTQLCSEAQIAETKRHIQRAAEKIQCRCSFDGLFLEKDWAELNDDDFRILMNCGYRINDYVKVIAGQEESAFSSVYFLEPSCTLEKLREKSGILFDSAEFGTVFRVKGCLQEDGKWYQINAVRDGITVEPMMQGQRVLIVIGVNLDQERIRTLLECR